MIVCNRNDDYHIDGEYIHDNIILSLETLFELECRHLSTRYGNRVDNIKHGYLIIEDEADEEVILYVLKECYVEKIIELIGRLPDYCINHYHIGFPKSILTDNEITILKLAGCEEITK